jgi:hypothetical protein
MLGASASVGISDESAVLLHLTRLVHLLLCWRHVVSFSRSHDSCQYSDKATACVTGELMLDPPQGKPNRKFCSG